MVNRLLTFTGLPHFGILDANRDKQKVYSWYFHGYMLFIISAECQVFLQQGQDS